MNSTDIRYIGVDDTDIDLFESQYIVPAGMSYNSYVILDDKVAIMDTVDGRKGEEWKSNLAEALQDRQPDYLVVQHMEPDHSSLLQWVLDTYPTTQLVCSDKAVKMVGQFFEGTNYAARTIAVKEDDTLALGSHTLHFYTAPMVHWPEVIVSYEEKEKVLFSADAFGKFGALSVDEEWDCEARRYYFNICGKYGAQVQRLLAKVAPLDIQTICPLHGPILNEDLGHYMGLYDTWSKYDVETEGVFIAYASIHGGTKVVAERLAEILRAKGCPKVSLSDLTRDDQAEAIEDAFRMGRLVVAAASYDGGMFPPMHDFLYHLQIKNWQKRRVGIIENGTWGPTAGRVMKQMLSEMKEIEIVEPMVTILSRMKAADEAHLEALADALLS